MDSGPDVEAPLAVIANSRNPLTKNGSQPEYTRATMRRACTTVQMMVDILRTQVRLYFPVAMSVSMANDRTSENTKRVKCGIPDQRPIYMWRKTIVGVVYDFLNMNRYPHFLTKHSIPNI